MSTDLDYIKVRDLLYHLDIYQILIRNLLSHLFHTKIMVVPSRLGYSNMGNAISSSTQIYCQRLVS
jgi:hypothetical protein